MTEDIITLFNKRFGADLTPIFNQYLRYAEIPTLEIAFDGANNTVKYRWVADEPGFNMPIRLGNKDAWQTVTPTSEWKSMPWLQQQSAFDVATDLYYVNVKRAY
jgi:hypothetical protein